MSHIHQKYDDTRGLFLLQSQGISVKLSYQNNLIAEDPMINIKDHKTIDMFDPLPYLGPKRRKLMESSWAKLFRDHVLFALPVDKIFKNYHWAMGRPTKELYAMLGVMILQQMHDLTDEETVHEYAFSIEWHYALDITDE